MSYGQKVGPDEFFNKLTPRQRQICALVALGLDNDEIGTILKMHPQTANKQIFEIRDIVELTRLKLVVYIIRQPKLEQKLRATLPDVFAKDKPMTP
jgi:DNA-binding CsgD family transcriptional regulator